MRYAGLTIVSLAIGFGAGFFAFDWPFGEGDSGGGGHAVANQLLQDLRPGCAWRGSGAALTRSIAWA